MCRASACRKSGHEDKLKPAKPLGTRLAMSVQRLSDTGVLSAGMQHQAVTAHRIDVIDRPSVHQLKRRLAAVVSDQGCGCFSLLQGVVKALHCAYKLQVITSEAHSKCSLRHCFEERDYLPHEVLCAPGKGRVDVIQLASRNECAYHWMLARYPLHVGHQIGFHDVGNMLHHQRHQTGGVVLSLLLVSKGHAPTVPVIPAG